MNPDAWNRKLNKQRLEKTISFNLKIKKSQKSLDPNCKHDYPDGMALAYLIPPFPLSNEEKLEMVKTCIHCGGKRTL